MGDGQPAGVADGRASQLASAVSDVVGRSPEAPYEDLVERSLILLSSLIGAVSYLQFAHLHGALLDESAWFDRAMAVAAEGVGLELPIEGGDTADTGRPASS